MSRGSKEYVDGMLVEWGAAFFNQGSVSTGSVGRGAKGLLPTKSSRQATVGTITKGQKADAIRGKLRAVANRSPEVMIKFVSGAPRGMRQIKRALDYISRKGEIALEEQDGLVTQGKDELARLKDDWQNAGAFIDEDEGKRIQAYHLVLSMPEGTDELGVKRAVRDFAAKELDGHFYVLAQHTFETDPDPEPSKHPHVHVIVKVRSEEGRRLNPRKDDLQRWRETYAQALRDNGIDATATKRLQRLKLKRGEKQSVRQIRDDGRELRTIGKGRADPARVQRAKILEAPALPSLTAFAAERGLEDFSEAEQQLAFVEAYGPGTDVERRSRRSRLIRRQLEALRWLERLVAQDPGADDQVSAWFERTLASRLEKAKLTTLADLAARINGVGSRWWTVVPGVGAIKAQRIVDWLCQHQGSTGLAIGGHVAVPRAQLQSAQLDKVTGRSTAVIPFEKFLIPAGLDGSEGRFRAPLHQCLLEAKNDYEAIAAWLATKHDPNGTGKTATHRAYRKEAERLLLWAILEQGKPLSSLTVEDVHAFKWFLVAPPARWCGPRHHQRWSPLWRPLEGPLGPVALRQAIVVLRSLYAFLVSQNYMIGNAFAGVALPRETGRVLGSRRTLTFGQWDAIEERLEAIGHDVLGRRRARAVRWLYATGLRLSEMANAQCGDLREIDYRLPNGKMDTGWLLSVVGKGDKLREVPVPVSLVEELQEELERHGLEPDVRTESNQDISILVRFEEGHAQPWSMSGLAKGIKALLTDIATDLEPDDAKQLRKASTHWLRHSHGSHALNGRPGEAGVPIQVVQNNLGHVSIGTTSGYLTTERDMRLAAMKGFGDGASRRAVRKT